MSSPAPIFIFDSTRLRSHLFFRFLSTSSNVEPVYHPFLMAGMFGPERVVLGLKVSEARKEEIHARDHLAMEDTFESSAKQMAEALTTIKHENAARQSKNGQPKTPIINEHWFQVLRTPIVYDILRGKTTSPTQLDSNNPTYIPTDVFNTMRPIILIRHPIYSVDSIYRGSLAHTQQRPGDEDFSMIASVWGMRLIYEYLTSRSQKDESFAAPIVVDGEDVLWRTDEISKSLCAKLDLNPLRDTWEPTSQEQKDKMLPLVYALTRDIHESTGIQRPEGGDPGEPRLEDAVRKWTEKYGETVAGQLRGLVEENLPHYEYLRHFKV